MQELFSDLSLKEKIGQLIQLPASFQDEGMDTGPAAEMGLSKEDIYLAGSYLSIAGAKTVKRMQKEIMEHHPHHIPLLFMADIINGYRTVFPIPLAQGATFAPAVVEKCAKVAATEAAAAGLHVTFSPMADLVWDPRWGRVMESPGEDPFLNGMIVSAMVKGYQGDDLKEKGRIAACLKHFAGYGAPEGGRDYNSVELSRRTLFDDYLPAYQAAVNAGCELVMTSFNTLDRIPSSANKWLLQDILREKMGFNGVIISDWNSIGELVEHGVAKDDEEAALIAIKAGMNIDMASPAYPKHLLQLVESGKVPEEWIDNAAWRVLVLKNKLGLFENPVKDADETDEREIILCKEHRELSMECAEKSFVLLKNDEKILPLTECDTDKVSFIGPYVEFDQINGSWSFLADDRDSVTLKAALNEDERTKSCPTAKGCNMFDAESFVSGFRTLEEQQSSDEKYLSEAVSLAKKTEKVVLALGEHREFSGEGTSKTDLKLPECQLKLLDAVYKVNKNIIVVLFGGRPLDIREIADKSKAVLVAWLPGSEGGHALVRTLLGDSNPSGKLPMCFPYSVGQLPLHYNHLNTGRPFNGDYKEGRFFSKYIDSPNEPLYPFGYGISYTEFSFSPVKMDRLVLERESTIHASVTITNTGNRMGTETVQLYVHDLYGSVARPIRQLIGFEKVILAPGEAKEVSFEINEKMLRFYNIDMEYTSEPGDFEVYIGSNSATRNKAQFVLEG